ncbi:MAG: HAMP domain-containing protein [Candidatus Rokubacteria bacterium]|nr:HAMP domain-containing protein [Candidatus Rokubacteria bacterium]
MEQGRQRGLEVEAIDRIHNLVYHLVADLHLALQSSREAPGHGVPTADVLREIATRVAAYEASERAQGDEEAREELSRLGELKALVAQLEAASAAVPEPSARGRPWTPAELGALNALGHRVSSVIAELHAIHQRKFQRAIDRSHRRMIVISALYVAFGLGGGLLLLVGDRLLFRHLVIPITRLAEAAIQIAGGNLSRRVPVRSRDEVGQLSRAFNLMAERLEAHDGARLSFEAELERQVKERTRELEETTARLRTTQAQLIRSERVAVTGQIAAGVTHEIRTPLNSLAINVQLLRRALSRDSPRTSMREVLDTLATVEYEITRINQILEEFVNFARLPAPRFADAEIGPLLQEILGLLEPQAAASGVRVEAPATGPAARVRGDPDQLRQVLLNLAQNALQAMPNGGELGVKVRRRGEWVEIAFTDSGPGIPDGERDQIFLPFVSTKPNGLGLGLAIVRRIVEEHGGSVWCENRAEGGATFSVRLPAARPADEP